MCAGTCVCWYMCLLIHVSVGTCVQVQGKEGGVMDDPRTMLGVATVCVYDMYAHTYVYAPVLVATKQQCPVQQHPKHIHMYRAVLLHSVNDT